MSNIKLKSSFQLLLLLLVAIVGLTSCGSLNQNTLFRTDGEVISDSILNAVSKSEKNYIIHKDDFLDVKVYTNKGELLVDPNQEMKSQLGSGTASATSNGDQVKYLVEYSGEVKLPLLGYLKVEGNSLRQLDSILQLKYSEFYQDVFVKTRVLNKRVFVLGNIGSKSDVVAKVIPLENENMSVIEVLTLAGGLDQYAKSNKIRLIRGDLKNPNVYVIDLSTIDGVRKSQMSIQPNDIIYVERQRRVVIQFLSELAPVIGALNAFLLMYIIIQTRL